MVSRAAARQSVALTTCRQKHEAGSAALRLPGPGHSQPPAGNPGKTRWTAARAGSASCGLTRGGGVRATACDTIDILCGVADSSRVILKMLTSRFGIKAFLLLNAS